MVQRRLSRPKPECPQQWRLKMFRCFQNVKGAASPTLIRGRAVADQDEAIAERIADVLGGDGADRTYAGIRHRSLPTGSALARRKRRRGARRGSDGRPAGLRRARRFPAADRRAVTPKRICRHRLAASCTVRASPRATPQGQAAATHTNFTGHRRRYSAESRAMVAQ